MLWRHKNYRVMSYDENRISDQIDGGLLAQKTSFELRELKEKFFAQYWGQNVCTTRNGFGVLYRPDFIISGNGIEDYHLLLKSLSDISDEDAIELMQILDCNPDQRLGKRIVLGLFENTEENKYLDGYLFYWDVPIIVDFLRSKGYLLPFNGLSTEELISRGWAVLSTNNLKTE